MSPIKELRGVIGHRHLKIDLFGYQRVKSCPEYIQMHQNILNRITKTKTQQIRLYLKNEKVTNTNIFITIRRLSPLLFLDTN